MRKKMTLRAFLQFVVCGIGGYSIFYVLFCRASFYSAFIEAMNVTNTQFGVMYSVYGWIAALTYFVGGIVADKVSPRILMFISFVGTGACNFLLGFFPSYSVCIVLYAIMGITTTVTFWAAMLKCVRIFGRSVGNENAAFSWMETTRGISGIIIGFAIVYGFNQFVDIVAGLRFVIWAYAFLLFALGIISLFVFDSGEDKAQMEVAAKAKRERILSTESPFKLFFKSMKNPDLWIAIAIAFGGYNVGSCIGSYYGDVATGVFGATLAFTTYLGQMNEVFKPIGAFIGSFITKKKGPTWILQYTTWIYVVIVLAMLFMPKGIEYLWIYVALLVIEIMCTGAFRSQKFIQIKECGWPMESTGTAFGVISTFIYTSDAFMPLVIGMWLDKFDAVTAYNRLYYVLLASCAFTLVFVYIWRHRHKARIKQLLIDEQAEAATAKG